MNDTGTKRKFRPRNVRLLHFIYHDVRTPCVNIVRLPPSLNSRRCQQGDKSLGSRPPAKEIISRPSKDITKGEESNETKLYDTIGITTTLDTQLKIA
jgi:hypothetical protein